MANNIKRLRLGFLFTPREFSRLIGVYPEYLPRLESGERALTDAWIDVVSGALGIPPEAVLDPDANIQKIVSSVPRPDFDRASVCPLSVRYGILAIAAKTCGLKLAEKITEDDLAEAVCSLIAFVQGGAQPSTLEKSNPEMSGLEKPAPGVLDEKALSRLSKGLQITALAILQSCFDDPPPDFQERLDAALQGAMSMIVAFSQIDERARPPEME